MYKLLPYMTNDGSVGLFDEEVNDIYHSAFGALSEAYEKFVQPALCCVNKNNLKVLDICYGIGYNSKALIEALMGNPVDLVIDCVDTDKILFELSPFMSTRISLLNRVFNKKELNMYIKKYSEAEKILKNNKNYKNKFRISNNTKLLILKNLIENFGIRFLSNESLKILDEKDYKLFFDKNMVDFYHFLCKKGVHYIQKEEKSSFVHNIYYKYVSKRFNISKKLIDNTNINMNFHNIDIRDFILGTNNTYDIVFLDGFTPSKCPCIWTVEFFEELYKHINNDGVLVTYNYSAPVRNAMKHSGFYIGDILNSDLKMSGTIASKNEVLIKHRLSERQEGLLNTKAGIPYHDENLKGQNEAILRARNQEFENSNLVSASSYLKK